MTDIKTSDALKRLAAIAAKAAAEMAVSVESAKGAIETFVEQAIQPLTEIIREMIENIAEAIADCKKISHQPKPPKNLMHSWTVPARRIFPTARRTC